MMTEQEQIERFLQLQEQAGQMTDEELQQALNDPQLRELAEQTAFAKRAFKVEELKSKEPDVDQEWEKFLAQQLPTPIRRVPARRWMKIAASFIGLLLVSGIAFAAIWSLQRNAGGDNSEARGDLVCESTNQQVEFDKQSSYDQEMQPVVFDNIPLDTMLADIAAYYTATVEYRSEDVRQLRFHFVWKREDGLNHAIEKLNRFESLSVRLDGNKIIVE